MCIDKRHPLHKLLADRVYKDAPKFTRLITDAIDIDKTLGQGKIKAESIVKIQEKIISIFNPESSKAEATKNAADTLPSAPTEINVII
jgi:DNA-directed RNA polymerase subunit F